MDVLVQAIRQSVVPSRRPVLHLHLFQRLDNGKALDKHNISSVVRNTMGASQSRIQLAYRLSTSETCIQMSTAPRKRRTKEQERTVHKRNDRINGKALKIIRESHTSSIRRYMRFGFRRVLQDKQTTRPTSIQPEF